ncbi:MAG: hypothetical protein QOI15_177 [Pseudonocardiales bacterium]|jgi:hypothetical protein|nr:hypothetical protein [Pseudonocardiales bacterium]MDT4919275.1 hypothetical protein [Pseudonocardiales bacterium]MDT4939932.1 hypothetical protein [Pseudonocardiales bacterium]
MGPKLIAACAAATGAAAALVLTLSSSAAGTVAARTTTIAIATFTPAAETTHNKLGDSVCAGGFVPSQPTSENRGDLNAAKGSFLHQLALPQGAVVQRLTLWANDFDSDTDAHVFLVRKLLRAGLSPQFAGYNVMASTASSGAVLNTMRRFTDNTVRFHTIDSAGYEYYLEVVNCGIVEPFAAQVTYTQ